MYVCVCVFVFMHIHYRAISVLFHIPPMQSLLDIGASLSFQLFSG